MFRHTRPRPPLLTTTNARVTIRLPPPSSRYLFPEECDDDNKWTKRVRVQHLWTVKRLGVVVVVRNL